MLRRMPSSARNQGAPAQAYRLVWFRRPSGDATDSVRFSSDLASPERTHAAAAIVVALPDCRATARSIWKITWRTTSFPRHA